MTKILATFALLLAMAPGALSAQNRSPVVVELFTSQGCSSCPPADALMHELATRDDVLPLALHVDYWDYIGWKDEFATPAHSARQKGYAHAGGRTMVYTPQMIVMGREDVVGAKTMKLADLIMKYHQQTPVVAASAARSDGEIAIEIEPLDSRLSGAFDVHLVRYTPLRHVDIKRGENAGRSLDYANVVDGWQVVATWDGRAPLRLDLPLAGDRPAAVLVQQTGHGPIVAAARAD
ncbi:DUF1223 domain-containing protein [Seohaeicola saemankumensis]|nr:DUF1223 domain-containing protein [Seohaeicola saemankumensis]MCA0872372.1 DUF1223 domain-containing protein [Seohaeicola saemankumensis]